MLRPTPNKSPYDNPRPTHDAQAWYEFGRAAIERGDFEDARQALLQSLAVGRPIVEQVLAVAHLLGSIGFAADAAQILRQAIELFPERVEPRVSLAWLHLESGDAQQAGQIAVHALRAHGGNIDLHFIASAAHGQLGALAESATHLGEILAIDPDHLEANRRLAPLLQHLGDSAGSERCLRRVVEVTGGQDLDAMTALGISLSGNGQHKEAIHMLLNVAKQRTGFSSVHADLGMALLAAGQLDRGIEAFHTALQIDPRSAQAYCGLGLAHQKLEHWEEAAAAFRATEQLAPEKAVGPFNLGIVMGAMGNHEEAKRALLRAAALEPEDPEIAEALQSILVPPRTTQSPSTAAPFQASITGDLKSFQLPDVLEFLRLQTKTGSLVVSSRGGTGVVHLVRGEVTSASAPGVRSVKEAADQPQLRRAVFQQVLEALESLLGWREGAFSFHPEADRELPAISFGVQNVMLELMRVMDERKGKGTTT